MKSKLVSTFCLFFAGVGLLACAPRAHHSQTQGKTIAGAEAEQYETVCRWEQSVGSNMRRKVCRDQLVEKQASETSKRELRKVTTRPQPPPRGAQ